MFHIEPILVSLYLAILATDCVAAPTLVTGRVVDETGAPVVGATLFIRDWDTEGGGPHHHAEARSDAQGRFEVEALPVTSRLFVRADGYASMFRTHDVVRGENGGWNFTLTRSACLSGKIVDTRGAPQSNRLLELMPLRPSPPPAPGVEFHVTDGQQATDADGRFVLSGLPPGDYAVLAYRPSSLGGDRCMQQVPVRGRWVSVQSGEQRTEVQIVVNPPKDFAVSGHVWGADGAPLEGMVVTAFENPHGRAWWTRTDATGAYCLDGLDGIGTPTVTVLFGDDYRLALPDVAMNTTDADLMVPVTGTILGTVRDQRTGTPVTDFDVSVPLVRLADGRPEWRTPPVRVMKQPGGRFVLKDVPAGEATVELRAKDLGVQRFTHAFRRDGFDSLDCAMLGPAVLEGRTTLNGAPQRTYAVLNGEWVFSDADGHFRFDGHANGASTLWFFGDEGWFRSAAVRLESGQTTRLDMDMGGSCEVQGTVTFPEDPDTQFCTVRLAAKPSPNGWSITERPDPEAFVLAADTVSRDRPAYHLRNIPPGRYYVMVGLRRPYSYRANVALTQTVDLDAHETLTLDLQPTTPRSMP